MLKSFLYKLYGYSLPDNLPLLPEIAGHDVF
jgi:hypothetical protein